MAPEPQAEAEAHANDWDGETEVKKPRSDSCYNWEEDTATPASLFQFTLLHPQQLHCQQPLVAADSPGIPQAQNPITHYIRPPPHTHMDMVL